jgi:hypothetical protein
MRARSRPGDGAGPPPPRVYAIAAGSSRGSLPLTGGGRTVGARDNPLPVKRFRSGESSATECDPGGVRRNGGAKQVILQLSAD